MKDIRQFINESKIFNKSAIAEAIGVDPSLFAKWLRGEMNLNLKPEKQRELIFLLMGVSASIYWRVNAVLDEYKKQATNHKPDPNE